MAFLKRGPLKRLPFAALLGSWCWLFVAFPSLAATPDVTREYQLKAAFLFNFTRFVEWPTNTFPAANSPFVIGILGKDPFGRALDDLLKGERVKDRPLVVRRFDHLEDAQDCQMLFISTSEAARQRGILASLKDRNILTVGESDRFARQGGIIRLVNDKNRVRLQVNLDAARRANLTLSSQLLRLAEIVKAEGE